MLSTLSQKNGNNLKDNDTLIISDEEKKVYLPYNIVDLRKEAERNNNIPIDELIKWKYILPLDRYKNSIRARYREAYKLIREREKKSVAKAISLGLELMFEFNLHPAIISACRNLKELDVYLDCLDDNELEKFSCFKIVYRAVPMISRVKNQRLQTAK